MLKNTNGNIEQRQFFVKCDNLVLANKTLLSGRSSCVLIRWKAGGIVSIMAERSPQELEQTPVEEARQKLKDECEQLWLKVQKVSAT